MFHDLLTHSPQGDADLGAIILGAWHRGPLSALSVYPLHKEFDTARGAGDPDEVGEPKLAERWLARLKVG